MSYLKNKYKKKIDNLSNITEEFDELGRLVRTCSGDVNVNKCEGACNSQVQPSVITPSGFLKVNFFIFICLAKPVKKFFNF